MAKKVVKKKVSKTKEDLKPVLNVGLVGHVDHGKTTLLQALSGKWADTHSEEQRRGITIKLGYADVSFYKDKKGYSAQKNKDSKFLRKISFVDAPGHETLMATMLSGAALMDGALLMVAANEECPQPQTREHLMALEISGIKNIIIVQNKIDLVTKEQAMENYKKIQEFIKGSVAEKAPIIPLSAQHNVNISRLIETMEKVFKTPKRDLSKKAMMFVARSFDVNKPGVKIPKILGGVLGGAINQGVFNMGDEIEIAPGRMISERGKTKWIPISTKIGGIKYGGEIVKEATAGGSLAFLTSLDPSVVKSDQLSGSVVTRKGELPPVWGELFFNPNLLKRVVGSKEDLVVDSIKKGEPLMINVNSSTTAGVVDKLSKKGIHMVLKRPICAEKGSNLVLSRRIGSRWRLIGTAVLE